MPKSQLYQLHVFYLHEIARTRKRIFIDAHLFQSNNEQFVWTYTLPVIYTQDTDLLSVCLNTHRKSAAAVIPMEPLSSAVTPGTTIPANEDN